MTLEMTNVDDVMITKKYTADEEFNFFDTKKMENLITTKQ